MVKVCFRNILVFWIMIFNITLLQYSNAQSKQNLIWFVDGYVLDFHYTPVKITKIKDQYNYYKMYWYIDKNGTHKLTVYGQKLYDEAMVEIPTPSNIYSGFFITMPSNENLVYYFEETKYHIIDVENRIIKGVFDISTSLRHHVSVHHANCDNIWIVSTDSPNTWKEYLVNSDGAKLVRYYHPDPPMKNERLLKAWNVKLSKDCTHYTATGEADADGEKFVFNEVRYGNFDRETGEFLCTAKYDFNGIFRKIACSMIAPDNSKIYYYGLDIKWKYHLLLEVPIIEGIPHYEQTKTVFQKKARLNCVGSMYYAPDGKIYLIDNSKKTFTAISVDSYGNTIWEDVYKDNQGGVTLGKHYNYMESWAMELPCNNIPPITDPCYYVRFPDVYFENSFVCNGEPLNIILPKSGTYSLCYTLDDKLKFDVNKIIGGIYQMPNQQGFYEITKISTDGCDFVPEKPISAKIGEKLTTPVIIEKAQ